MSKDVCILNAGYDVDEYGNAYNPKGKLLKQYCKRGYMTIAPIIDKKHVTCGIHRLVATKYIPNPENKPEVNHIDGDKTNNCVTNLEWVTRSENRLHALNTGLVVPGVNSGRKSKEILCVETGKIYKSAHDAERDTGIYHAGIIAVCNKTKQKTAGGYHWQYYQEE